MSCEFTIKSPRATTNRAFRVPTGRPDLLGFTPSLRPAECECTGKQGLGLYGIARNDFGECGGRAFFIRHKGLRMTGLGDQEVDTRYFAQVKTKFPDPFRVSYAAPGLSFLGNRGLSVKFLQALGMWVISQGWYLLGRVFELMIPNVGRGL